MATPNRTFNSVFSSLPTTGKPRSSLQACRAIAGGRWAPARSRSACTPCLPPRRSLCSDAHKFASGSSRRCASVPGRRCRRRRRPDCRRPLAAPAVFEEMSLLAAKHQSINLGQGFPDNELEGPEAMKQAANRWVQEGPEQQATLRQQSVPEPAGLLFPARRHLQCPVRAQQSIPSDDGRAGAAPGGGGAQPAVRGHRCGLARRDPSHRGRHRGAGGRVPGPAQRRG